MDYEKLRNLLPKVHTKWTTDDVAIWLGFIGLESLYPTFSIPSSNAEEASIDGSCLACLTEDDLRVELNIKSGITIKKLAACKQSAHLGIKVGMKEFDEYIMSNS